MKKLPDITLQDWLSAEELLRIGKPLPPGYITITQYAALRGLKAARASAILRELAEKGLATKQFWIINGKHCSIYRLEKK